MAEKKIGDRTFKVDPPLATVAIVMQARLMKAVGPAIDKLPDIFAGARASEGTAEKDRGNAAAVQALTGILSGLKPEDVAGLLKDLTEMALIKRPSGHYEPVDFDGDFSGRLGEVIPVITFVVREVFGDFFSGAVASGRGMGTAAA
ncbi:hypothetical protein FPY71_10050 [Aureimonas fodinaquatilis]|uniref:Uncharacterized protein n=1 Tax=Aureimonas fodinaquatilis TaxID=2565783 RepID=A0A5B0DWS1_9HYPH|nr:hypothetical protein [Aureimonas fodinaquatilis]KAA0970808.1 hypothetical protein FPY71_10050 [Aureimonas fodinaquatilis]